MGFQGRRDMIQYEAAGVYRYHDETCGDTWWFFAEGSGSPIFI